jgi:hypothetical protein
MKFFLFLLLYIELFILGFDPFFFLHTKQHKFC